MLPSAPQSETASPQSTASRPGGRQAREPPKKNRQPPWRVLTGLLSERQPQGELHLPVIGSGVGDDAVGGAPTVAPGMPRSGWWGGQPGGEPVGGLWRHAHNGLASARQEGRGTRPLAPGLRGLCALWGHAHNGLASACALFEDTRTTDSLRPVRSLRTRAQRTRFGLCAS
jgi:hypothetical protein